MDLKGYVRSDGRAGFRNHALILPLTGCSGDIARRIGDRVPGTTWFAHPNGCDLQGPDFELMGTIFRHFVTHPNVGGVLFLSMGCAAALSLKLDPLARQSGRLVEHINIQQVGGTSETVAAGAAAAEGMVRQLAGAKRQPVPFSSLVVGTKCGASDENSFRYCHPVVGKTCDRLVEQGATVVLSEDCELIGCAEDLAARASSDQVASGIRGMVQSIDQAWSSRFGHTMEELVLTSGQTKERFRREALQHAAKAGTTAIRGFFDMSESAKGPGLVILNAPNTDLESMTCQAAAGCQVILFTTGRGTPVGSPASITLKITATRKTCETMAENIDVCVADVAERTESVDAAAQRAFDAVIASANGELTAAERCRHYEVAIPIRGVTF